MSLAARRFALPLLLGLGLATSLAMVGRAAEKAGNAQDGEDVFRKCQACHTVGPDAKNRVGPILNDVIGRKAGTVEGFTYSAGNRAKGDEGLVWTEENLFKYLEDPRAFVPNTTMAFAGLKDEQDRLDVIAYLKQFSKK